MYQVACLQFWNSLSFYSPLRPSQTYYSLLLSAQASFTQHLGSHSWRWSQCICYLCISYAFRSHSFSGYSLNTYNFVSLLSYSYLFIWNITSTKTLIRYSITVDQVFNTLVLQHLSSSICPLFLCFGRYDIYYTVPYHIHSHECFLWSFTAWMLNILKSHCSF